MAADSEVTYTYEVDLSEDLTDKTELTNDASWAGDRDDVTITVSAPPGDIEVLKIDDETEAPLPGAKFQLWSDADKSGGLSAGDSRSVLRSRPTLTARRSGKAFPGATTWSRKPRRRPATR